MIAPMKKVLIIGAKRQKNEVVEKLQRLSCVQIEGEKENFANTAEIDSTISSLADAIKILSGINPQKQGLFEPRKRINADETSEDKRAEKIAENVIEATKKKGELKGDIGRLNAKISYLSSWLGLNAPLELKGTEKTREFVCFLPFELGYEKVSELMYEKAYFEIISQGKDATRVYVVCLKEDYDQAFQTALKNGFSVPDFNGFSLSPKEETAMAEREIEKLLGEIREIDCYLKKMSGHVNELKFQFDFLSLRRERVLEYAKSENTQSCFILEGFAPEFSENQVKSELHKLNCYVEFSDAENTPVLLLNNGFARPVEGITSTYSMPGKGDIDPNFIMAFFYYLFFGMMFSDAGYGLLLALGAGYFAFVKKTEESVTENMKMFFFCGISTFFWGLMYGSFFGNAIPVVSGVFFGREIVLKPLWLDPVKEPLTLLIFSVALGLIQILVGLFLKFYILLRQGQALSAVFDVGFWILVLIGIGIFALGINIGIYMAVAGVIGLILTQGRHKKNIFAKIFGGILSLYDVTSYVSDALSYSRLMALGLATGVIAQVVNTMGTLSGGGVLGAVVFAVVFVIGHSLNFAINCLGAYVHTNRLQYVEFFSKFYEGGGKAFKPLKMNTKYYEFTEEKL